MRELKEKIQNTADEYIELYREKGMEPEVSYKDSFNVRVTPETRRAAAVCAANLGTMLNNFVATAIEKAVKKQLG